jgi:tetraacyldisaccharide 4'-kinase
MREPAFWRRRSSWLSRLLMPLGAIYGAVSGRRMALPGVDVGVPVFCIGNYHVGGAGKTPTTLALVILLRDLGEVPVVLSRGYGGRLRGPVSVDPARHLAADVGDEPMMMAGSVPVVVSRDRVAGAALARSRGASVILMDDGFQNPALVKDAALIVIDGHRGLGNGRVIPAGPLRAPLPPQLARTDALIIVGDGRAADTVAAAVGAKGGMVLRAHLVPDQASVDALRGKRVLAFAGIGDPARFFATLRASGIDVVAEHPFPDHHPFVPAELDALIGVSRRDDLTLVTTHKDLARIGAASLAVPIAAFAVTLDFDDPTTLRGFVRGRLDQARAKKFRR